MTYETFLKVTEKRIKDFLPEGYQNKMAVIEPVTRNNGIMQEGFSMRSGKEKESVPVLYLEPFYEEYRRGRKLEEIWRELAEQYEAAQENIQDISIPVEYEKIKDSLYVSVCNAGQNSQRLQAVPHDMKEDLALTYHCRVSLFDEETGDIMVNNRLLYHWGIKKEQLQKDAWNNMKKMIPPVFVTMEEMIEHLEGTTSFEEIAEKKSREIEDIGTDSIFYVLTNTEVDCGAVYMFDEDLMARIADRLDFNLLVLASSTHEILILKETKGIDLLDLQSMVEEINRDFVKPEDKLSDEVYRYDKETHSLKAVMGQDSLQSWQIKLE